MRIFYAGSNRPALACPDLSHPLEIADGPHREPLDYARPTSPVPVVQSAGVRVVKAKSGDTVTKLAEREGISAIELAKYNGLLPTSILPAGREIKVPSR